MELAALKDRLVMLAKERLKNRPFDYATLLNEIQSPFHYAMNWEFTLMGVWASRTSLVDMFKGSSAWDDDLINLIDTWSNKRSPPSVPPLPPYETARLASVAATMPAQGDIAKSIARRPGTQHNGNPTATIATSANPPGKLPKVAIGKLAIKAALEIENETKRAASRDDVIALLQKWADAGIVPETLIKAEKSKRGVVWQTKTGKPVMYDIDACGKTLATWRKTIA